MNSKSIFLCLLGTAVAIPIAGSMASGSWRADTIEASNGTNVSNVIDVSNAPNVSNSTDKNGAGDGTSEGPLSNGDVPIDASHFADDAFRDYVKQFDTDKNGKLSFAERDSVDEINCPSMGIKSAKGLEYFPSLISLDIMDNNLEKLDVSKNTKLLLLECSYNKIRKLDLTENKEIQSVFCQGDYQSSSENGGAEVFGELASIDISKCEKLFSLHVSGNRLTSLNIQNNPQIDDLDCSYNQLSSIDVSKQKNLTYFYCDANQLTSLDVTNNRSLLSLRCSDNKIKSIDVSGCFGLETLCADHNQLTSLDVSQNVLLSTLEISYTQITEVDITNTVLSDVYDPSKLKAGEKYYFFSYSVDDIDFYLEFNKTTKIVYTNKLAFVCKIDEKTFPDALFRKYVSQFDLNKDGSFTRYEVALISSIYIYEEEWLPIQSVKGIEYFYNLCSVQMDCTEVQELILGDHGVLTSVSINGRFDLESGDARGRLEKLDVSGCPNLRYLLINSNTIESADLSANLLLEDVNFANSLISKIDLSKCKELTRLNLSSTNISSFDFSANTGLTELSIESCEKLHSIDISMLTKLQKLECSATILRELDVSHNPALTYLECVDSGIKTLDVSANPELRLLNCSGNSISKLDVSHNTNLIALYVTINNIQTLDVSKCTKLETLYAEWNELTSLDVTNNPNLVELACFLNPNIRKLDVSKCTKLESLRCQACGLSSLDISKLTHLKELRVVDNHELTELDLSSVNLQRLDCSATSISSLDLSKQTNLIELAVSSLNLEKLDVTKNTKLVMLDVANNLLTELDLSHQKAFTSIDLRLNMFLEKPEYKLDDEAEEQFEPQKCVATVTGLKMVSRSGTEVSLAWDEVKNASKPDYWEVYRSETKDGKYKLVGKVMRNSKVDETAEPEKTYYYYVVGIRDMSDFLDYDDIYGEPSEILEVKGNKSPENPPEEPSEDPTFEDFVERLYTVALGRASEPEGKAFWIKQVVEEGKTGADCARFFLLDADEFMKRGLSVEDFVETLYATFFDRESDAAGKQGWVNAIKTGAKTRAEVVNDFIESTEWCDVCATYGVKSGAQWHKATKASKNAVHFATRLYTCCLKRDAEQGGLDYWSLALTNLEKTGAQAAQFFFESEEFVGFNTTLNDYLNRMYTTFMDRQPAVSEIEYWVGEVKAGRQNRHSILAFFAQSPEFSGICKKYGIDRGEIG